MRLIRFDHRKCEFEAFEEFADSRHAPAYAVLSHQWGQEEITFHDMLSKRSAKSKASYSKIYHTCRQAAEDGLRYVWVDTCCIDKTSSAELSEAINSMYQWYSDAKICYAYLGDMQLNAFRLEPGFLARSGWFTRGWTLQELIAPSNVVFFVQDWQRIGTKRDLCKTISVITNIDEEILLGTKRPQEVSIARRMSWASQRETTRTEDIAYCLLGLFDVSMPLLYGEGEKAFARLQEEIMKNSDDQTLFAWHACSPKHTKDVVEMDLKPVSGLLALSPAQFADSADIVPYRNWKNSLAYSMTNQGLRIELPMYTVERSGLSIGILSCRHRASTEPLGVHLWPVWSGQGDQYARCRHEKRLVSVSRAKEERAVTRAIYVRKNILLPSADAIDRRHGFFLRERPHSNTGYVLRGVWPRERWKSCQNLVRAPTRKAALFFEGGGPTIVVMVRADFDTSSSLATDIRCTCKLKIIPQASGTGKSVTRQCEHPLGMMEELARSGSSKTFAELGDGRRAIAEIRRENFMGEEVFTVEVAVAAENEGIYELPGSAVSDTESVLSPESYATGRENTESPAWPQAAPLTPYLKRSDTMMDWFDAYIWTQSQTEVESQ